MLDHFDTVVVVLGFASGLGRAPTVAAEQQASAHPPAQPASPDHVTGTAEPVPVIRVGQPQHQGTVVPRPNPTHPSPTHPGHPGGDHPDPTHPPTTPPPTTTPPPKPPCDVDAISALLTRLGALVEGLPVVSDLTAALPVPGDGGLVGGLTGVLGGLLGGVVPAGGPAGAAVIGVGGLPDLSGVAGTATSTGALPVAGTSNAELNGLLGDRCGLLVQPADGRVVGLLSTP
ncbi:hypothetical protein [Saccharothrix stipae]